MTRRDLISLPAAALFAGRPLLSQTVFPGVAYRDYSRCLPDYLRILAERAYQLRNREIAKLTTPGAIRRRQDWARQTFWNIIGGMPERTPLNARKVGEFERDGYRVEKILYESVPNFPIPANLYIPTRGNPPYPGVLFQLGHSVNGKVYDSYQRCCQGLVKLGYLVLAFDPMGQGERIYYPNRTGKASELGSSDEEHTYPGKQMLLVGDTSTRLHVWDAVRSLDYLAAHPLVDPKRLASTGQSGGGTLTMMLACVDDRLTTAAVSSGNTENIACANYNPPGSTDDAEQDFLNSSSTGFDRWDLLYPIAPKPLLINVSDKDFFGTYSPRYISNGWEEFGKLRKVYETLGKAEQLRWVGTPLPHGLSYDSRLQIYNWFARWMKNDSGVIETEPPTSPEPEEVLRVTERGNVVWSLQSETPFSLNKRRPVIRKPAPLNTLIRAEKPAPGLKASILRSVPSEGIRIEAIEVPSAPKVWIPAWFFRPNADDRSKPIYLVLEPNGRNTRWHQGEMYQVLAAKGYPVCVPDLRCIGDLTPEFGRGSARHARPHNSEEDYTWASLIFGKPLLGQWVTDILAVAAALRSHPQAQGRRLEIAALGKMTVPAIFAAALDKGIDRLYLSGGLVSYQSLVDTERYTCSFGNFVPNLLLHTDLPEIVSSLAPRKVTLAGTVGGSGKSLDPATARQVYEAASNVEITPETTWDAEALG